MREYLKANVGESEYLIEFELYDTGRTGELENLYQNTALPQNGTAITHSLLKLMSSLTDGIVAAVIILIDILLIVIATLCLRFTMLATIEEDYREIGVMKAIGIHSKDIRRLHLTKYVVMAAAACVLGYILSLFIGGIFTQNITLYMGGAEKTLWNSILPFVGAGLVFAAVAAFCRLPAFLRNAVFGRRTTPNNSTLCAIYFLTSGFCLSRVPFDVMNATIPPGRTWSKALPKK